MQFLALTLIYFSNIEKYKNEKEKTTGNENSLNRAARPQAGHPQGPSVSDPMKRHSKHELRPIDPVIRRRICIHSDNKKNLSAHYSSPMAMAPSRRSRRRRRRGFPPFRSFFFRALALWQAQAAALGKPLPRPPSRQPLFDQQRLLAAS